MDIIYHIIFCIGFFVSILIFALTCMGIFALSIEGFNKLFRKYRHDKIYIVTNKDYKRLYASNDYTTALKTLYIKQNSELEPLRLLECVEREVKWTR